MSNPSDALSIEDIVDTTMRAATLPNGERCTFADGTRDKAIAAAEQGRKGIADALKAGIMTHPEDATAYLKAKLEDRNPKCGNCKHWVQSEHTPSFGGCMNTTAIHYQPTQDLSLCSAWEKKQS